MEKVKKNQKQKNLDYASISGLYSVALLIPIMSIPVIYTVLVDISHKRARTSEEAEEQRKWEAFRAKLPCKGGNGWEMWSNGDDIG